MLVGREDKKLTIAFQSLCGCGKRGDDPSSVPSLKILQGETKPSFEAFRGLCASSLLLRPVILAHPTPPLIVSCFHFFVVVNAWAPVKDTEVQPAVVWRSPSV